MKNKMGFLNKLFGSSDAPETPSIWKTLQTQDELNEIIAQSEAKPVALFKHSTRCSISSMAKSRLERNWNLTEDQLDLYYLDLIAHRDVSNQIAALTGVQHQSPQILLLKGGKVIYHTSHNDISAENLKEALATG